VVGHPVARNGHREATSENSLPAGIKDRIAAGQAVLVQLLRSPKFGFDSNLWGSLPEEHGIYRIFEIGSAPTRTLHAGRTKSAQGGLRQRVYQNHYMGDQSGNIRAQLVKSGRCTDKEAAKKFLRRNCKIQFFVIENEAERKWAEHFMLSILRPEESD